MGICAGGGSWVEEGGGVVVRGKGGVDEDGVNLGGEIESRGCVVSGWTVRADGGGDGGEVAVRVLVVVVGLLFFACLVEVGEDMVVGGEDGVEVVVVGGTLLAVGIRDDILADVGGGVDEDGTGAVPGRVGEVEGGTGEVAALLVGRGGEVELGMGEVEGMGEAVLGLLDLRAPGAMEEREEEGVDLVLFVFIILIVLILLMVL
jgi:hypothetical protein